MLCKGYFLNKYDILSEIIVAHSQEYFHGRRGVEPFNKEGVSHVLEYFSLWKLSSWLGSERGTELWFRGVTPLPSQPVPMTMIAAEGYASVVCTVHFIEMIEKMIIIHSYGPYLITWPDC